MPQVEKVSTPLTPEQVVTELIVGYANVKFGTDADNPRIPFYEGGYLLMRSAFAIIGVENAGGRSIFNHNFGNQSATPDWIASGRDFYELVTRFEGQPTLWRAFATSAHGSTAWWRMMFRNFPSTLRAMLRNSYRQGRNVCVRPPGLQSRL